jgi:hypothetical protein
MLPPVHAAAFLGYKLATDGHDTLSLHAYLGSKNIQRTVRYTEMLSHPEMLTILNNENLHRGRYVSKSKELKRLSSPALDLMNRIYDRGVRDGVFRAGLNPVQLYLSILALNYFYVSNRCTLSAYLGIDLGGEQLNSWRRWVSEVIPEPPLGRPGRKHTVAAIRQQRPIPRSPGPRRGPDCPPCALW